MITTEQIVEHFFTGYKKQQFQKGEIIIRADDEPSGIYFIQKGRVKMYAISSKGEEVILNIFKEGTFFPMSWLLTSNPNKYYFEVSEDTITYKSPKAAVLSFLHAHPDVTFDLLQRVFRGLDGVLLRMAHLMGGSAYIRLIHEIIINADRFGKNIHGEIVIEISEIDLAKQTGLTRETVSREMKRLKDKGLVKVAKSHIIIVDRIQLLAVLQEF